MQQASGPDRDGQSPTRNGSRLVLDGCRIALDAEQLTLRWWDDDDVAWEARASVEAFEAASGRLTVAVVGGWGPAVLRQAARVDSGRTPVELLRSEATVA